MPKTERAREAAGAELNRRRSGAKPTKKPTPKRPMGSVSQAVLRDLASKPGKKKS